MDGQRSGPTAGRSPIRSASTPERGSQRRRRRRPWGEEELRHPAAQENHGGPRPDQRTFVGAALAATRHRAPGVAGVLACGGSHGPMRVMSVRTAGRGGDGSVGVVDADADQGEGRQQDRRDDRGAPRPGERERHGRQGNCDGGSGADRRDSDNERAGDEGGGHADSGRSHVVATEHGDTDPPALVQMSSARGVRRDAGRRDGMTRSQLRPRR